MKNLHIIIQKWVFFDICLVRTQKHFFQLNYLFQSFSLSLSFISFFSVFPFSNSVFSSIDPSPRMFQLFSPFCFILVSLPKSFPSWKNYPLISTFCLSVGSLEQVLMPALNLVLLNSENESYLPSPNSRNLQINC